MNKLYLRSRPTVDGISKVGRNLLYWPNYEICTTRGSTREAMNTGKNTTKEKRSRHLVERKEKPPSGCNPPIINNKSIDRQDGRRRDFRYYELAGCHRAPGLSAVTILSARQPTAAPCPKNPSTPTTYHHHRQPIHVGTHPLRSHFGQLAIWSIRSTQMSSGAPCTSST